MHFTREPIIETIISAKDGYKLSIKSSKGTNTEEYLVDAVEVVSLGGSFFYRCQEKPKTFFIPAQDFEILEVKETRILIKNPNIDKSIKIAGGKETPQKNQKKDDDNKSDSDNKEQAKEGEEQKREKKRGRKAKPKASGNPPAAKTEKSDETKKDSPGAKGEEKKNEGENKPTVFSHLLTPPPGLISDNIAKYKQEEESPKSEAPKGGQEAVPMTLTMSKEEVKKSPAKEKPFSKKEGTKDSAKVSAKEQAKETSKNATKETAKQSKEASKKKVSKLIAPPDESPSSADDSCQLASEPPKLGEELQETDITAEPFVKATSEKETK